MFLYWTFRSPSHITTTFLEKHGVWGNRWIERRKERGEKVCVCVWGEEIEMYQCWEFLESRWSAIEQIRFQPASLLVTIPNCCTWIKTKCQLKNDNWKDSFPVVAAQEKIVRAQTTAVDQQHGFGNSILATSLILKTNQWEKRSREGLIYHILHHQLYVVLYDDNFDFISTNLGFMRFSQMLSLIIIKLGELQYWEMNLFIMLPIMCLRYDIAQCLLSIWWQ